MTVHSPAPFPPSLPPAGHRLELGVTAAALRITISDMEEATGLGRATVHRLLSNEWPVRADKAVIQQRLRELFAERGASAEQLERLFWAFKRVGNHVCEAGIDGYGRPIDHVPQPTPRRASKQSTPDEETEMLLPKQSLSPAARKAFGLFTNPFDGEVTSDEQMFTSGEFAYVREACMQAAVGGRFVAVVGESGAGKTTVLADLESRIERDKKPVIVIRPWVLGMAENDTAGKTLKSADILASIITTLDRLAVVPQTLQARSNRARDLLTKSIEAGFSHLLAVEEAHDMPEATLKHLKRLHEMRLGRKPLLGILLLGQTELGLRLDPRRANLREVTQRCEVVQLLPLDADLGDYLAHRAGLAGKRLDELIDASGVEEIRARLTVTRPAAGGKTRATSLLYPLAVNNLVTAAMNVAADLGAPIVTRDVVRAV